MGCFEDTGITIGACSPTSSDEIIYTGGGNTTLGITNGMTLTDVIDILSTQVVRNTVTIDDIEERVYL